MAQFGRLDRKVGTLYTLWPKGIRERGRKQQRERKEGGKRGMGGGRREGGRKKRKRGVEV